MTPTNKKLENFPYPMRISKGTKKLLTQARKLRKDLCMNESIDNIINKALKMHVEQMKESGSVFLTMKNNKYV